jgi:hypothetical protein
MPWLVGVTSDRSSLRLGLATSTACPLFMAFVLLWMQRQPLADFLKITLSCRPPEEIRKRTVDPAGTIIHDLPVTFW